MKGIAYLYRNNKFEPLSSVSVDIPEKIFDWVPIEERRFKAELYAAHELMRDYRVELVLDDVQ
jgi:hypothetical protein